MFEKLNYAELDKLRDALLEESAGQTEIDEGIVEFIEKVSVEMEHREAEAHRRVISATKIFNILVLGFILFLAGCQTLKGVTGDAGWMLGELSDNIQVQEKPE